MLPSFLIFAAGAAIVIAVWSLVSDLFLHDRQQVSDRFKKDFRKETRERVKQSKLFKEGNPAAAFNELNRPSFRHRVETLLLQSGLDTPFEEFLGQVGLAASGAAGGGAAVGYFFFRIYSPFTLGAVALVLGGVAAYLPFMIVKMNRQKRQQKLFSQLPDAFDVMARVVRAGQTMPQAMEAVAEEFERPIAEEFAICSEQQNLGLSADDAIRDLARRTGLIEVKIFAMAIIVQRQTGGNMAQLLDNLATIVRERFRIQGLIRTLTAESRMQAIMLIAAAPAILLILTLMRPQYVERLYSEPGYYLLVGLGVSELLGWLVIRKIINFEF